MVEGFKEEEEEKKKSFYFVVVKFQLIFGHPCFLSRLCMLWGLSWGWRALSCEVTERISGAVCHPRKADNLQSG